MRRATLACASLLLLAGLTACGNDDSGDDSSSEESSSASATPTDSTSPSEDESSSTEAEPTPSTPESESDAESDGPESDDENADYCDAVADAGAASDAKSIEDLRAAVDELVETLPDTASGEAQDGVEYLQSTLAEAKTLDDFTKSASEGSKEDLANTKAYGEFETATCPSDEAPTPAPSE